MAWQGRLLGIFNSVVLISTIGAFWLYKDGFLRKPKIWIEHAYNALNFGLPLIPHAVGGMLIVVTDRVLINKILGIESVGIYTVAIQAGMVIGLVVESFNKAYAPWLYKRLESNSEIANRKIVRFTYAYFIIIIFFGVIYGLAAPKILSLLVGDEFLAAGELIIYTSLGFALSGCYYMVTNYIFFSNKNGYLAILSFFAATLNIPITYFLLITQGIVGAAMAYFFISLLIFLCTWLIASRTHKMPWFSWLQSERN
jgi:O-antigen/teichoic acid export membrane protein